MEHQIIITVVAVLCLLFIAYVYFRIATSEQTPTKIVYNFNFIIDEQALDNLISKGSICPKGPICPTKRSIENLKDVCLQQTKVTSASQH